MQRRLSCALGQLARCLAGTLVAFFSVSAQDSPADPGAQSGVIRCSATAAVPIVRIEGTSELVGDILLTCHSSGSAASAAPREFLDADITLSLNVGVSNRTDFGLGADVSDAVLVVNENNCAATSAPTAFRTCEPESPTVQGPMLARLDPSEDRTLHWNGIVFPIPGAAIGSENGGGSPVADCAGRSGVPGTCHPQSTTVRLTNIRANAAQLGASGEATGVAVSVEASLTVRAAGGSVRLDDSSLEVAEAAAGLTAEAGSLNSGRICSHNEAVAEVMISEGFAAAFKTEGKPSFRPGDPGWEESFYPHSGDDSTPGYGLVGTRLRIALSGLPERVSVHAPASLACSADGASGELRLGFVDGAFPGGLGGTVAPEQAGERMLEVSSEYVASAVYEVTSADPLVREDCRIPFRLSRSGASGPLFKGGRVEVSANLAPFRTAPTGGLTSDESRFIDVGFNPRPSFSLTGCGTALFFPFVTNRGNFDTAIVIANTSADPLGTRHQSGQCIMRYQGSGVEGQVEPSIQRSAEIEAGRQLAFTLSSGSPAQGLVPLTDFQGYLVAECGFQHGHGFAFVTEQLNGTAVLAQGYLAQIVRGAGEIGPAAGPP